MHNYILRLNIGRASKQKDVIPKAMTTNITSFISLQLNHRLSSLGINFNIRYQAKSTITNEHLYFCTGLIKIGYWVPIWLILEGIGKPMSKNRRQKSRHD